MNQTEHILHIARLKNNCPECYATDGLEISFVQMEKETQFYKKHEAKIDETLFCHSCGNVIYPVNWTEDIERVYQYNKKQATPKNSVFRLKPISYGIIVLGIILVATLLYGFILQQDY